MFGYTGLTESHISEQAIGETSEKAVRYNAESKYPDSGILLCSGRECRPTRGNNNKGEYGYENEKQ